MLEDFPYDAIKAFSFESLPQPISASLRPIYRIALLLLVLRINCSRGTASLIKLQFFNWIMKSEDLRKDVLNQSRGQSVFTIGIIHMDPMVNLALKYAFAEGLVKVTRYSKYEITEKGVEFADYILNETDDFMVQECEFLESVGKRISEVKLKRDLGLV